MDLDALTALGQKTGLSGKELAEFVFEKSQEQEREERKYKRDMVREEQERDHARQMEHVERERKFQLDQEDRKQDRESQKEILALQIKLEEAKLANNGNSNTHGNKSSTPKLPSFEDGKDDLDAYLQRFERFAYSQHWNTKVWAVNLSALLKGKALGVYSRLSSDEADDYDVLKQALLRRYNLTEDGFKLKFRTCKPEIGETPSQFSVRLENYFCRWIDLAKVKHGFDELKDLLLREQFINVCGPELAIFLKERTPTNVNEMAKLAEQYTEAHGGISFQMGFRKQTPRVSHQVTIKERPDEKKLTDRKCYICDKIGHIAKDCRLRQGRQQHFKAAGMMRYDHEVARDREERSDRFHRQSYNNRGRSTERPGRNQKRMQGTYWNGDQSKRDFSNWRQKDTLQPDTLAACEVTDSCKMKKCCVNNDHVKLSCGHELPLMSAACRDTEVSSIRGMPITEGFVGSKPVSVLRDSGCSGVVIRKSLVSSHEMTGQVQLCILIDGTVRKAPVANLNIDTPFYVGVVEAVCMDNPVYDLILGNIDNVRDPGRPDQEWKPQPKGQDRTAMGPTPKDDAGIMKAHAVETRHMKEVKDKAQRPLKTADIKLADVTPEELRTEQQQDASLRRIRELAQTKDERRTKNGITTFTMEKGLLYNIFVSLNISHAKTYKQLIVPVKFREQVIQLAHDAVMGGHMGVKKTTDRISSSFYWPGIHGDVNRFCRSCDVCQRTIPKGNVPKVPLCNMPLIDVPFKRIAVDLVGPIFPTTEKGNRYILTIVDYATRYPEAVALRRIETHTVAEALVDVYARVGVPEEILTDMGSQFTSDMMKEVGRLLSMRQLTTTPYHPMCNGLVEKFNGTLKRMLRKMCAERPKDWDRYLTPLLFAYREAPQASLGFSPFQLLYGREVRGPMNILREVWTQERTDPEVKTTYQYVIDLRSRIEETLQFAQEELKKSSRTYKKYYDRKARSRKFKIDDSVLILLPTDNNKLLMQWKGPYQIIDTLGPVDYRVNVKGKTKTYHANMLKKYHHREQNIHDIGSQSSTKCAAGILQSIEASAAVIEIEDDDKEEEDGEQCDDKDNLMHQVFNLPSIDAEESSENVHISSDLSDKQKADVRSLLEKYERTLTSIPGETSLATHDIAVTSSDPIRLKPYPIPYALRDEITKEVDSMLKIGVIEPSASPYSSPIVIVKKKDNTNRFCVDFRQLNRITIFDAEPMAKADDIFANLAGSKYFSKIDLSKGYWQIKLTNAAKEKTAFVTPKGLFQFTVMPFGLVNAPATFNRLMRKLLSGIPEVENYVDDVLLHTLDWIDHLQVLNKVFERLKQSNLTARPSKCLIGYSSVEFLGHIVGSDTMSPHPDKIKKMSDAPRPQTKKQLRSFLGLVGFYRKFLPNFAAIAVPLTDMTKKGQPNQLKWEEAQMKSFHTLKQMLITPPLLQLPDFEKQFILQTDASDVGIGAILLQDHDGEKLPISYASKKLLPRERAYSVIERECLALVWGIKRYQSYLYGKEFILQTDHQPLIYLNKAKLANGRLMRWALFLQQYRMKIEVIKGSSNVGADFLSRHV